MPGRFVSEEADCANIGPVYPQIDSTMKQTAVRERAFTGESRRFCRLFICSIYRPRKQRSQWQQSDAFGQFVISSTLQNDVQSGSGTRARSRSSKHRRAQFTKRQPRFRAASFASHPSQRSDKTAGGGARTHTILRSLDFESSASANSATPARRSLKLRNQKRSSSVSDPQYSPPS